MQLGKVVGHAVATIKHTSLEGWRLTLVQMLTADGKADGDPQLAIDPLGAGVGSIVIACNDGASTRKIVGHGNTPARWQILGLCDDRSD